MADDGVGAESMVVAESLTDGVAGVPGAGHSAEWNYGGHRHGWRGDVWRS